MTPKSFDKAIREFVGPVLEPHGFSAAESKRSTFVRRSANSIVHIILPDRGTRGEWFDVLVYATSPDIDPTFEFCYPDSLGVPSDSWCRLSKDGIGSRQMMFTCRTRNDVRDEANGRLGKLLIDHALPYLDPMTSVEAMLPSIQHFWTKAFALDHVGRRTEAKEIVADNLHRLAPYDASDPEVCRYHARVHEILGTESADR